MPGPTSGEFRLLKRVIHAIRHGGAKTVHIPGLQDIGRGARSTGKWLIRTRPGNVTLAAGVGFGAGWHTRRKLGEAAADVLFDGARPGMRR